MTFKSLLLLPSITKHVSVQSPNWVPSKELIKNVLVAHFIQDFVQYSQINGVRAHTKILI